MQLNKKKFLMIYLTCCLLGITWVLLAGCSRSTDQEEAKSMPRTPQEAGIAVLDSSNCENCHLSPEMISSFEKPKTEKTAQSEGG